MFVTKATLQRSGHTASCAKCRVLYRGEQSSTLSHSRDASSPRGRDPHHEIPPTGSRCVGAARTSSRRRSIRLSPSSNSATNRSFSATADSAEITRFRARSRNRWQESNSSPIGASNFDFAAVNAETIGLARGLSSPRADTAFCNRQTSSSASALITSGEVVTDLGQNRFRPKLL